MTMASVQTAVDTGAGMRRIGDARDISVIELELEKEDVLKLKPIYEAFHTFLIEEGYEHPVGGDEKIEDLYWERWVPSGAKEQHIWWRVKKDINKYIRYYIQIDWQTLNATKAEVAYKGKKVSGLEKTDVIVRIKCFLQWDMNNLFKDSMVWKFKKAFFNKLYNEEIKKHKQDLERFALKMSDFLKTYFEMTGADYPTTFHPKMGYKEPDIAK
jgi:hypothetical protein